MNPVRSLGDDASPFLTRQQASDLLDERDRLKREVARLRGILEPVTFMPRHWELTGKEQTLLETLRRTAPEIVTRDQMLGTLYAWEAAPKDLKTVYVFISNIRRKLAAANFDLTIEGHYGNGWSVSARDAERIAEAIEADRASRLERLAA